MEEFNLILFKERRNKMSDIKMITCPACKKEISSEATNCPKCGQPISEEVKKKSIQEKIEEKKNVRIGCLIIVIFSVIYGIYGAITAPDRYFSFDEKDFMARFTSYIDSENKIKEYGKINCVNIKSKNTESVYKLNDDTELSVLKDASTGKVWRISICYDDRNPYDESVVIWAVTAIAAELMYFNYFGLDQTGDVTSFFRAKVMSLPRDKRGTVEDKEFHYGVRKTKDHEPIPVISVEIKPGYGRVHFIAEEGAPTYRR